MKKNMFKKIKVKNISLHLAKNKPKRWSFGDKNDNLV